LQRHDANFTVAQGAKDESRLCSARIEGCSRGNSGAIEDARQPLQPVSAEDATGRAVVVDNAKRESDDP
jgi:hypothetical protein